MDVVVDSGKCQGHGKCYLVAPEVFEPEDDWGHARTIRRVGPDDGPLRRRVQNAIDGCPERALSWQEDPSA
jgi:ferredoxin